MRRVAAQRSAALLPNTEIRSLEQHYGSLWSGLILTQASSTELPTIRALLAFAVQPAMEQFTAAPVKQKNKLTSYSKSCVSVSVAGLVAAILHRQGSGTPQKQHVLVSEMHAGLRAAGHLACQSSWLYDAKVRVKKLISTHGYEKDNYRMPSSRNPSWPCLEIETRTEVIGKQKD